MKKISFLLIVSFIVLMTACSIGDEDSAKNESETSVSANETTEHVAVDKGASNVEVTLPATMFEGEDTNELIDQAEDSDVTITENEDGSLTYTMPQSEHQTMMEEMNEGLEETINGMKNGTDFPSIKEITYDQAFSEFTVTTDREAFESGLDNLGIYVLGISGMYYQLLDGKDPENYQVKILVKDEATGEIFQETLFPDVLEEVENDLNNTI